VSCRVEGVLECELPGELLLHVPGGAIAVALNASARAVWELCDGRRSLDMIASDLPRRFDAPSGEIAAAVGEAVLELTRLELLVPPTVATAGSTGVATATAAPRQPPAAIG
jgi:hypothetical protein